MSRTSEFNNMLTRNFQQGYGLGSDQRKRQGESDLASFNVDDYTIPPPEAAPAASPGALPTEGAPAADAVEKKLGYAEGGDSGKVDALLKADADEGAVPAEPADYGKSPIDRAMQAQKDIPVVNTVDWEAAKKAKADAYARAGQADKAANIDQEFADLKQRRFQNYATRALQVLEADPARAAKLLNMASQYSADGTTSKFLPTPGGQLLEIETDELTGKPLGSGTPVDKEALSKFIMMNADPTKFLYSQMDRDWKEERAREQDKQWSAEYGTKLGQFAAKMKQDQSQFADRQKLDRDKMAQNQSQYDSTQKEDRNQWSAEMDYKYDKLDLDAAIAAARNSKDDAEKTGYTMQQWDKKVESLNDYVTAIGDPMKFRNEFGEEYQFTMDEDGLPKMPDMLKLRTGAESIMGANGHNKTMSPQTASELFIGLDQGTLGPGRMDVDKNNGRTLLKGKDGVWYYAPNQGSAAPVPTQ